MTTLTKIASLILKPAPKSSEILKAAVSPADISRVANIAIYN